MQMFHVSNEGQRGRVFNLAIEADSFLSRNKTRFVSVINIDSLALSLM